MITHRMPPGSVAIAIVLAISSSHAGAGPFRFAEIGAFPAGSDPAGLAIADLNGDGRLDVVAANDGVSTVSILLGRGILDFHAPAVYASAPQGRIFHHPQPLATGDFNGDGVVDYAVTSQYGGPFYVSVSLGMGNGQFRTQALYEVGYCPTSVSTADVNLDGSSDLIVSNVEASSISVLLGNGDGTFHSRTDHPASGRPVSLVMADFNRDGHVDAAMVDWNSSHDLTILRGLGNGNFGPPVAFAVGANPRSLVSGDFDRDGVLDIAVANGASGSISVLRGYGNGTFASAIEYPLHHSGWVSSEPNSIVAVDLDRDGNLDLAVADFARDSVAVFRGNSNGVFNAAWVMPVAAAPSTIASADFNRDGSPDLAVLHYDSGRLSVLLNDGIFDGSFDAP